MNSWEKNKRREEILEHYGPLTGLPLFSASDAAPSHVKKLVNAIPKAIPIATDTKRAAHMAVNLDEYKLGEKQTAVYNVIASGTDWSIMEIAKELQWQQNCVGPRVFELRQLGLVVPADRRQCRVTGKMIQSWKATPTILPLQNKGETQSDSDTRKKEE
jgi:hypothetical protein